MESVLGVYLFCPPYKASFFGVGKVIAMLCVWFIGFYPGIEIWFKSSSVGMGRK